MAKNPPISHEVIEALCEQLKVAHAGGDLLRMKEVGRKILPLLDRAYFEAPELDRRASVKAARAILKKLLNGGLIERAGSKTVSGGSPGAGKR